MNKLTYHARLYTLKSMFIMKKQTRTTSIKTISIQSNKEIKKKQYTQWIENYTGEILLVGINYDKLSKHHECVIEKLK